MKRNLFYRYEKANTKTLTLQIVAIVGTPIMSEPCLSVLFIMFFQKARAQPADAMARRIAMPGHASDQAEE